MVDVQRESSAGRIDRVAVGAGEQAMVREDDRLEGDGGRWRIELSGGEWTSTAIANYRTDAMT